MARGRTVPKFQRVYINGYDLSPYTRNMGPLSCAFAEGPDDPLSADIVGTWLGQATISPGTLNGIWDNTVSGGIHTLLKTPPIKSNVMVVQGVQAVPAQGDPVFCGQFQQDDYLTDPAATPSALTIKFSPSSGITPSSDANVISYAQPWGVLLHANTAVTTDNTAVGVDLADYGMGTSDATTDGGWMMYQVTAGAAAGGTANIKVQHAAVNADGSFADLLTTGDIDVGTAPASGVVALATTTSVSQFVRWQVTFNTATSVTFLLAFIRGKPR